MGSPTKGEKSFHESASLLKVSSGLEGSAAGTLGSKAYDNQGTFESV